MSRCVTEMTCHSMCVTEVTSQGVCHDDMTKCDKGDMSWCMTMVRMF